MIRSIVAGSLVLLALSACSERVVYLTPEQAEAQRRAVEQEAATRTDPIQRQLPPGCVFRDHGMYNDSHTWVYISAIYCGKTVTTNTSWRVGKSTAYEAVTTQNDENN